MSRLWVCTDHATHYPVGGASVVWAPDEKTARALLAGELRAHALPDEPFSLREIDLAVSSAVVLLDGDY